jgi:hypothetical protein
MATGKKGDRLRHVVKAEWGIGQMLEDVGSQRN